MSYEKKLSVHTLPVQASYYPSVFIRAIFYLGILAMKMSLNGSYTDDGPSTRAYHSY